MTTSRRNISLLTTAILFVVVFSSGSSANAALITIADYQGDFQGPSPATGWAYEINSTGAIGNPANYTDLLWSSASRYNFDGLEGLPRPNPGQFAYINGGGGGHPGPGTAQGGNTINRYVIASYPLQPGDDGPFSILNGPYQLSNSSITETAGGTGIDLKIYINNAVTPLLDIVVGAGSSTAFNANLGLLNIGDTVYVAVGPNGTHSSDSFSAFDFSIQADLPEVPEPSTLALLMIGGVGMQFVRRRARRNRASSK